MWPAVIILLAIIMLFFQNKTNKWEEEDLYMKLVIAEKPISDLVIQRSRHLITPRLFMKRSSVHIQERIAGS